ncbi:MAG: hypothetical protein N2559_10325 [Anaerolineae bacterium]|nr:hypothetical protein [Anaerolineae bacterium]
MSPAIILGVVLASLYALVFYVIVGHGWLRLIGYWLIGVAGFFVGHALASLIGLRLFDIGELHAVEGTLVSWLSCVGVYVWRRN